MTTEQTPRRRPRIGAAGAKFVFTEDLLAMVTRLFMLGLTVEEVADAMGYARQTFTKWMARIPELKEAVEAGRVVADAQVAQALYRRAIGATWTEQQAIRVRDGEFSDRIEIVEVQRAAPPDTAAAFIWLQNRQPDKWKQRRGDSELKDPEEAAAIAQDAVRRAMATAAGGNAPPAHEKGA